MSQTMNSSAYSARSTAVSICSGGPRRVETTGQSSMSSGFTLRPQSWPCSLWPRPHPYYSHLLSPNETLLVVLAFESIPAGIGIALVRSVKHRQSYRETSGRALFLIGLSEIVLALVTAQMFAYYFGGYDQVLGWLGFGLLLSIVGRIGIMDTKSKEPKVIK